MDKAEPTSRSDTTGERHLPLRSEATLGPWRDACLPLTLSYLECHACERACPAGALRVAGTALSLSDACIGCGRRAATSPTGTLGVAGCTVPASAVSDASAVHVDNWKAPRVELSADTVCVPCLGAMAMRQWLALVLAAGGRPVIALDRGRRQGCSAGGMGPHPTHGPLAQAAALRGALGAQRFALLVLHTRPLPARKMPRAFPSADAQRAVNRRDFFGRLAREATAAVVQTPEQRPTAHNMQPTLRTGALRALERERRLAFLRRLAMHTGTGLPARLFATLAANSRAARHSWRCLSDVRMRAARQIRMRKYRAARTQAPGRDTNNFPLRAFRTCPAPKSANRRVIVFYGAMRAEGFASLKALAQRRCRHSAPSQSTTTCSTSPSLRRPLWTISCREETF